MTKPGLFTILETTLFTKVLPLEKVTKALMWTNQTPLRVLKLHFQFHRYGYKRNFDFKFGGLIEGNTTTYYKLYQICDVALLQSALFGRFLRTDRVISNYDATQSHFPTNDRTCLSP